MKKILTRTAAPAALFLLVLFGVMLRLGLFRASPQIAGTDGAVASGRTPLSAAEGVVRWDFEGGRGVVRDPGESDPEPPTTGLRVAIDEAETHPSPYAVSVAREDEIVAGPGSGEVPDGVAIREDLQASGSFVRRRIPRSQFRAAGTGRVVPPTVEPPFDSFEVRRIALEDFPAAQMTHRRIHERNELARAAAVGRTFPTAGPMPGSTLWDEAAVRVSSTQNRPRSGSASHDDWYDVRLARLFVPGRLDLGVQVGDRDEELYLARGYLGFAFREGWLAAVGDQDVGYSGAGLHGTTARGVRVERASRVPGTSSAWKAGVVAGRTAVQYANLVNGDFPRSLETAYLRVERPRRQSLEGVAYRFSGRDEAGAPVPDGIESGSGIGLVGSFRRTGVDLRAEVAGSAVQYDGGGEGRGGTAEIRGRGGAGPATLSGHLRKADGEVFEVGSFGALQRTPDEIVDATLSLRPGGRSNVSVWGGRWSYPPSVLADTAGADVGRYALRGDRAGGRVSWRSARGGTGVSVSGELRRRTLEQGGTEEVVTRHASVSQRLRRGLDAALTWNQLDYDDRSANNYLTGAMSLRAGRNATLTVQQRTFWQEPLGPRLESIVDFSSLPVLDGRVFLSTQFAVRHEEQQDGSFRRTQTQGRLLGDCRLGPNARFSGRYQLIHSLEGLVHTIDLALSHRMGGRRDVFPGSGLEPVVPDSQIVQGRVFEDRNGDGEWQSSEPGVPGVEIAIDEDLREPLVTDLRGVYRAFLSVGQHFLQLIPASVPTEYALDGGGRIALEVMSDRAAGHDFPLVRRVGTIEGDVVDERTGIGVPGVKVILTDDLYTYTDASGSFRFLSLSSGEYRIRIDLETLPFGYQPLSSPLTEVLVKEYGERVRCAFHVARPVHVTEF